MYAASKKTLFKNSFKKCEYLFSKCNILFSSSKLWNELLMEPSSRLLSCDFFSVLLSGSSLCTASHYRWTWHVVFGMCFAEMERRRYSGQDWEFWGCTKMFYCRWISSIVHSSFPGCLKTLLHTHSSPASQTHRWSVTTAGGTRSEIHTFTTVRQFIFH